MRRRDRHAARVAGINDRLRPLNTVVTLHCEHLSIRDAPVTHVALRPWEKIIVRAGRRVRVRRTNEASCELIEAESIERNRLLAAMVSELPGQGLGRG